MQNGNKVLKGPGGRLVETETGGVGYLGDGLRRDLGFASHGSWGEETVLGTGAALFSSILHPVFKVCTDTQPASLVSLSCSILKRWESFGKWGHFLFARRCYKQ